MFPGFTQHYRTNGRHSYTHHSRQLPVAISALRVRVSYLQDYLVRQLGISLALSSGFVVAPLLVHVCNIFLLRTKPKMGRVNAKRIVARWAIVADNFADRYFTMCEKVRIPVGRREVGSCPKLPVSIQVGRRSPEPAVIGAGFRNFFPKANIGLWENIITYLVPRDIAHMFPLNAAVTGFGCDGCYCAATALAQP